MSRSSPTSGIRARCETLWLGIEESRQCRTFIVCRDLLDREGYSLWIRVMDTHEPSGFTLVEVLVSLVLLSMVAAIVFGSLRQVIEARTRLRPYLDQSEQTTMAAGWFRQTVQGLMADYDTGRHR